MIKNLYIKNFILIEEVNLDFEKGFSVFTGETGAGKSILIDAISLLYSDRANSSLVSRGKEKAIIEGTFDLSDDPIARKILSEAGFETEDEYIFTREIHSTGKSTSRINHRVVTFNLVREVLQNQIDIHGQRDSQYLLNTSSHIHLLDSFLQNETLIQEVKERFQRYDALRKERDAALSEIYNENDLEYLQYQKQEIDSASLKEGEEEELQEKEKQYRSVKNSLDKMNQATQVFDRIDPDLYELVRVIQSLPDEDVFQKFTESVNDSYYVLADTIQSLKKVYESYDFSEEEINEMQERLFLIQKLKRKYGGSVAAILSYRKEIDERIESIENREEYLARMNQKTESAFKAFLESAEELSALRKEKCRNMDDAIIAQLRDLSLPNAMFCTSVTEASPSSTGVDRVEFLISMNKGEELKPLSRTASGGELSRLMLGLKVIFSHLHGTGLIIFDEIDTGVSGSVASSIGMKMKELSSSCQVFSVTHLAPVAAWAHQHYLVKKESAQEKTATEVVRLNKKQIIDQLALIASGTDSPAALKAATELYERSGHH